MKVIISEAKEKLRDIIFETQHKSNSNYLKSKHYAVVLPHGESNGWCEKGQPRQKF